jgi:hypothetical protein
LSLIPGFHPGYDSASEVSSTVLVVVSRMAKNQVRQPRW